ncbi:hypothetical protein EVAR_74786_1 [Eumeta japonica]|uniref:Uncharacterized protein n=1 Tax=Eumeta variegata TaxID=151549 RepID=A0A4C1SPV2_EUMVA|nr:hypothetical protein EVAR_74786_1 [Eumeta japonica]
MQMQFRGLTSMMSPTRAFMTGYIQSDMRTGWAHTTDHIDEIYQTVPTKERDNGYESATAHAAEFGSVDRLGRSPLKLGSRPMRCSRNIIHLL